jgi:uncharacterized protein YutE (UPF0331/DUF86 family)
MPPDRDRTILKVDQIKRCVGRAREERAAAASNFAHDHTRQDAAVLNVERACETTIALALSVVTVQGLTVPLHRRDAFMLLAEAGLIAQDLAARLAAMVAFRRLAIHSYTKLEIAIVEQVIDTGLDDLVAFADAMLARMDGSDEDPAANT